MAHPLLANLDGLTGPELKARFAEARTAAISAGAQVEADAATRALQTAMRNAVRAMAKGIDARTAAPPAQVVAAPVPAPPRPPAPMRPVAPPPLPVPVATTAPAPVPAPKVPARRGRGGRLLRPPAIDPDDVNIPF